MPTKKCVILICYNRPQKTKETLHCLRQAYGISSYHLIVVRQTSNDPDCEHVHKIINAIDWIETTHLTRSYDDNVPVVTKIQKNIFTGFSTAFDHHGHDLAVLLEDDICVSYDALHFFETMIQTHDHHPLFRAVNGYSLTNTTESQKFYYSKFRYGVGNGWAISKKKWHSFFKPKWPQKDRIGFDSHLETACKMGFVIMPYASRTKDIGWGEKATFAPLHPSDLNKKNEHSWINSQPFHIQPYQYQPFLPFDLRDDCVHFHWYSPITYLFYRFFRKCRHVFRLKT